MRPYQLIGTQGRTRTGTPVTEVDFESTASTIPPLGPHVLPLTCSLGRVKCIFQLFLTPFDICAFRTALQL